MRFFFVAAVAAAILCAGSTPGAAVGYCDILKTLSPNVNKEGFYWTRGDCAGELGDRSRQVEFYRRSLHLHPIEMKWMVDHNRIENIFTFTAALAGDGELPEARWWWRSLDEYYRQLNPGYPAVGDELLDVGDYSDAFQAYFRALYVNGNNPDYTGFLGEDGPGSGALYDGLLLAAKGDYRGAIADWNAANAQNSTFNKPNFVEPTFYIGCAQFALGHRAEARRAWIEALTLSGPAYPDVRYFEYRKIEAVHLLAGVAYE